MTTAPQRTCLNCHHQFSGTMDFCPICLFRDALAGNEASCESSAFEEVVEPALEQSGQCFEPYELVKSAEGTPVVLGRGAMGVTYKAVHVDLRCPVTLKVISQRYLGDEAARLRFLREARTAASVRHPNVASVFHLGRTGQNCFYAMEFVEGETLASLIERSGRLELNLALEIAAQIAAGLAAVHKQKLVHRDIKPSNIMVSLDDENSVDAKIIDLGLAKPVLDTPAEVAISTLGVFAGTPEFASPEQFAGIGVDIRSDLYSLGATLWAMLTGKTPFRGTPSEVMHQHQHAPLPLDQLRDVPRTSVPLLEALLQKDPARRFQSPADLLKALTIITTAPATGRGFSLEGLERAPPAFSRAETRRASARPGPKKISLARLPVTGSDVFGREEDIAFLDDAWANQRANVVTIVAWAGVGKSTLVNHWLRRMAVERYRSAQWVFGWSFYRQGTIGDTTSAEEFLHAALSWFRDPDPRIGTAWEKGERLAKLVARRRTLLVLDGLEPLQHPPGPQEGRLREPSLQALLRELAAFNTGLCVITTRLALADLADHEGTSALRRDLEQLSSEAGAQLLQALGVTGHQAELQAASEEFAGHCLALTLLGSYLTDAYSGDIRFRQQVSKRLGYDVRQGVHARKVMESYQTWFGEGPELSVLRMLGLFDRPVDEKVLGALLKPPAIRGLTESLTNLTPSEWRTVLARLRRARLLAAEDPHHRGHLDTHPLVREYFGEQLRSQRVGAWKECNRRLFHYYQAIGPRLPNSSSEMEPLFLAVVCGCQAGLFREALHEVYIPRIQRGEVAFAAKELGIRGALLSALAHFFEPGRWGSPAETTIAEQALTPEDQLFILLQAGLYLIATRGFSAPDVRICYELAESMCHSLRRPLELFSALEGLWRYSLVTGKLTATMQIANRAYAVAREQENAAQLVGACRAFACTHYFMGNFESARQYALRGEQLWRSGGARPPVEQISAPGPICLCYQALSEWHLGDTTSSASTMAESIARAKELNDMHGLAVALQFAGFLGHFERNPAQVERCASDLVELATRQNFALWLAIGAILRGWARSVSGDPAQGLSWIEDGVKDYQASGSILGSPFHLALKAEVLHRTNRTSEAIETIREAYVLTEKTEARWWCAELHRLRAVFLASIGGDEIEIESSLRQAILTANQQKSASLAIRGQATLAEYRRQKADGSGRRDFRVPLY